MSLTKEEATLKHMLEHQLDTFEFLNCQFEEKELPPSISSIFDCTVKEFRRDTPEVIRHLKHCLTHFEKEEKPVDPKLINREW